MSLTTNRHHHRIEHSCLPAICPGQCPCNKFIIFHSFASFHSPWSVPLQQDHCGNFLSVICPGLVPNNKVLVLVPTTRSSNAVCHLSCSVSLQQGHLKQFVILTDQCHLSFASCQVSWSSQATFQRKINEWRNNHWGVLTELWSSSRCCASSHHAEWTTRGKTRWLSIGSPLLNQPGYKARLWNR